MLPQIFHLLDATHPEGHQFPLDPRLPPETSERVKDLLRYLATIRLWRREQCQRSNPVQIVNESPFSPFAFSSLGAEDSLIGVIVCRATLDIVGNSLVAASEQQPVVLADVYRRESLTSSVQLDTDLVPQKRAADITLNSVAYAPQHKPRESWTVSVRVGQVSKTLRVTGERCWKKGLLGRTLSRPELATSVPLCYELAFGGTCDVDGQDKRFELNPVGQGFAPHGADLPDEIPAPQIEDPSDPVTEFRRTYAPAGVGPIAKHWMPRRQLCGTADETWKNERWPLRPTDFDFRYYNSASPGLIYPGFLEGNEEVLLTGLSPDGPIAFRLPGLSMTVFGLRPDREILLQPMVLDTLHIDTEEMQVSLTWRLTVPGELKFSMIQLVPEPVSSSSPTEQQSRIEHSNV